MSSTALPYLANQTTLVGKQLAHLNNLKLTFLKTRSCHSSYHVRDDVQRIMSMTVQLSRVDGRRSAKVSDHQEHEDAGEQHASDHDELILGGPSLD